MKAFVTGATGFLGGALARKLRARGDDVVALVRSPGKAGELQRLGCQMVAGDLSDVDAIREGVKGCDAAFHVAAYYAVGVPPSEREAMFEANVHGTERVLDAATEAGAARIVYVSTINTFGNTRGQVVDETYQRPDPDGPFLSIYDETKYRAHQIAEDRISKGAPVMIAAPGGIYGPGDPSVIAVVFDLIRRRMLPFKLFPDTGFNFVYVDDCAEGLLLIHDKGRLGESYVLGGEISTVGETMFGTLFRIQGRRPPRFTVPRWVLKASTPLGPMVGKLTGLPPNLNEGIRAIDSVTYWATDRKAREELGYAPRDLESGLRETLAAAG
ncbi:MAG TPA: NAD-dependent epimerase/dehydratase family protein [Actinomycetota bacterium]